MPIPAAPIAIHTGEGARLLCGSSKSGYRDRQGREWDADAFYSGGTASPVAVQPVWRTRSPFLFRSMRSGEFSYKIPLKPGVYEMRLYFVDTSYAPGSAMEGGENVRVFNVLINGDLALRNFDIIADAGPSTADVKVFKNVSPAKDGYLHLAFSKVTDAPLINAIEIVPGMPRTLLPIRIVTQDSTVTDQNGTTWFPDNYFLGGRTIADSERSAAPKILRRLRGKDMEISLTPFQWLTAVMRLHCVLQRPFGGLTVKAAGARAAEFLTSTATAQRY